MWSLDNRKNKVKYFRVFAMGISMALGGLYYYFITLHINTVSEKEIIIESHMAQDAKLYFRGKYKISSLTCNDKAILFDNHKKHGYFYHGETEAWVSLHRGSNACKGENIISELKQKITFFDLFVLLLLVGIPLFGLFFSLLIWIIKVSSVIDFENKEKRVYLIWIVLGLGVLVRIVLYHEFGTNWFQHDIQAHLEYIKYVANYAHIPMIPMQGIEFPQQPLYYLITGTIYKILTFFELSDKEIIYHIGYVSLVSSLAFLYYAYRLLQRLTRSKWTQLAAMIFVALTPSIVYMSLRINNDALVTLLATMALYYSIKSYQEKFMMNQTFLLALFFVSISFLSKISTAGLEVLLFILLLMRYYKAENKIQHKVEKSLYIYGIVGLFVLGITLLRLYVPVDSSFYMVNSATFLNQTIPSLDIQYFMSVHLLDLIQNGTSYVFGQNSIRHSFLTYQYGTMIFGEFNYLNIMQQSKYIHLMMQFVYVFGMVYIVATISYFLHFYKEPTMHKIIMIALLINFILVLKFIFMYPSVCNTDFRYYVSSFILFGYIFAKGLFYLLEYKILELFINSMLVLLVGSELVFFYLLVGVSV
jgi:4-amino-4-deoxy-L-arabinose transferase-like glycosyltransferase